MNDKYIYVNSKKNSSRSLARGKGVPYRIAYLALILMSLNLERGARKAILFEVRPSKEKNKNFI